jgi:hypothetical protein
MSKSRAPLFLGLAAAGGVGYYFYSAGGDAKAAENKFESVSPLGSGFRTTCMVVLKGDFI